MRQALFLVVAATAALVWNISAATTARVGMKPLRLVWPTSVDVEPNGSLLIVENGLRRLLLVDPATGRVTRLASLVKPYAVQRAPSGSIFVTDGPLLLRIDGTRAPAQVAVAGADIGPMTIAPNGDVYYSDGSRLWKLAGVRGAPVRVGRKARLSAPHGLAVAADGALLVADTGNHRVLRVAPGTGAIETFAHMASPRGMDIAGDGTVYVVDGSANDVVHLRASGTRLGIVGKTFDDPYDVAVAPGGALYVLESLQSGDVRRVAADGTVTVVSRR